MADILAWTFRNTHWIVGVIMALTALVSALYVLGWERRLARSPVVAIMVGAPLYTAVVAIAFGELRPALTKDPLLLSWLNQVLLYLTSCISFAIITAFCTRFFPRRLRSRPFLNRLFSRASLGIVLGWVVGTLVLYAAPDYTAPLIRDLSAWGHAYRWLTLGTAAFYATSSAILFLITRAEFGAARTKSEAAMKRRLLFAASGSAGWALLFLDHTIWPHIAQLWPNSQLGVNAFDYLQVLIVPIFILIVTSYLALLLTPYRPTETSDSMASFNRYRTLTESIEFRVGGFTHDGWTRTFAFARASRLIELAAQDLGLHPRTRRAAADAYALASISSPGPASACRVPPPQAFPTTPASFEELLRLHHRFLGEPDHSPRKRYAEQNRFAAALPYALAIVGRRQPTLPLCSESIVAVQLLVLAAADHGLLGPDRNLAQFNGLPLQSANPVSAAYNRARQAIERPASF